MRIFATPASRRSWRRCARMPTGAILKPSGLTIRSAPAKKSVDRVRVLTLFVWLALGSPTIAAAADMPAGNTLNVFAAASLREAFTVIGKRFEDENHVVVRFNLAGADMLANQIVQGAPADVFASANEAWAKFLEEKGELGSGPQ